ncbi:MAG: serine/threonine protein kinase [Polyangiaceae bacterium]|nr:protein kinase [Polyangiaceae bacterium]NUQ73806.1 serine/threonine protein kinase [Polyangiaceae bacterium]
MDSSAFLLGNVIGARYRIEALLGEGGMAVVYQARHTSTGKLCALKLVRPHLVSRPELREMFVREAQIAGRIGEHPHIVNVYDAGVDEARKIPFIAMELLKGQTLEHYLEANGRVPPGLFRAIAEQLGDALEQAHRAGVIHRDLKPGNLFLTADRRGRPVLKVMDFGIAKVLEQGVSLTATHIGSPAYAAPEQQSGSMFRKVAASHGITIAQGVSPATDVWALGLVAYELLTGLAHGQYWAAAEAPNDLVMKITLGETELPSARAGDRAGFLPPGFDAWFERCLRKNAAERFPTAGDAVQALLQIVPDAPYEPLNYDSHERRSSIDSIPGAAVEPARGVPNSAVLGPNTLEMDTTPRPRVAPSPPISTETSGDWTKTSRGVDRSKFFIVVGAAAVGTIVITSGLLWLLLGEREPSVAGGTGPTTTPVAVPARPVAAPTRHSSSPQAPPERERSEGSGEASPAEKVPDGKAILKIRSNPGVCRISVDDVPKGPTPMDLTVLPGVYVVGCKTLAQSQQRAVVLKLGASELVEFDWSP